MKIVNEDTLNESTLNFISYLKDSFNITYNSKSEIGAINKRKVTEEKIREVYTKLPEYFPHDSSFKDICHNISEHAFSGFYWGNANINNISNYIARYALYTPKMIIINPFCDMLMYHREESPLKEPKEWIQPTINQILFLVMLEPWIREGIITLLPPLKWFDFNFFRDKIAELSRKRLESYDENIHKRLDIDFILYEVLKSFKPEHIEPILKSFIGKNLPQDFIQDCKEIAKSEFQKNPIRYAYHNFQDNKGFIVKFGSGTSLDSTLFTAELCGAYILFGEKSYKNEYDLVCNKEENKFSDSLTKMSVAFSKLDFSFLNAVKLDFVLSLRKEERLSSLRSFLIKLWDKASSPEFLKDEDLYEYFKDELKEQYRNYKQEWTEIDSTLGRDFSKIGIGGGIAVLSGQMNFRVAGLGLVGLGIIELITAYEKRKKHRKLPLGVFLDLERKK